MNTLLQSSYNTHEVVQLYKAYLDQYSKYIVNFMENTNLMRSIIDMRRP